MRAWRDIPDNEQESIVFAAKKMRPAMRWSFIAATFDVSAKALRNVVDAAYHKRTIEYERERNERIRSPAEFVHRTEAPRASDVAARLAEIPPDYRSLTGRVCGDPLPGLSALDKLKRARPSPRDHLRITPGERRGNHSAGLVAAFRDDKRAQRGQG